MSAVIKVWAIDGPPSDGVVQFLAQNATSSATAKARDIHA